MKYWILPVICEFSGMGIGLFILFSAAYNSDKLGTFPELAVMGVGIAIMGWLAAIGLFMRFAHLKRILKKHNLWQDEEIKKKDLPK